ncbi:MAG TPA: Fe-S cluster assembly protein SufB [Candidatus Woesearchaeota archaeon]|nr:Fe-S cluster assembly protein SufB [Candidatus Woesearchaeota archaeon]
MKAKSSKKGYVYRTPPGITKEAVIKLSEIKKDPAWMRELRLKALDAFLSMELPSWSPEIPIDFSKITLFTKSVESQQSDWEKLPKEIKETFDRLGIPQAEREFLAGSGAQYESEVVYKKLKEEIAKQGVIFSSMDEAIHEHPETVKEYFGRLIPYSDNKYSALNTAAWSGGTFIYIPKGVKLAMPLQTYYRMNFEGSGQFERTLIIVDEGAEVHYVEGCTAPLYSSASLHAGVVEIFAKKNSRMRFSTVQNWSKNVLNLTTKRGLAEENAVIEWIDGNLGSGLNMKYPAIILKGNNSRGDILSITSAGQSQNIDAGGKVICVGKNTSSKVVGKGISFEGGTHTYRGLVKVLKTAENSNVSVNCDALLLDDISKSNTYPTNIIQNTNSVVKHEASVGKIEQDKLFYLMSKGISEEEAKTLVVLGFLSPIVKELPMEYAVELNKLIRMQMENSVG